MGKGSKAQAPTRTTSVTTNLPEYAEPFYTNLLERTEAESNRPLELFPGQRFATFAPEQEESFQRAAEIGRQGVPDATRLGTLRAAGAAAYEPTYRAGAFDTEKFIDPDVAAQYMNPFVENVIDTQRRREQQRFDETVPQSLRAQAAQRGAFGGSRGALQEQLAQESLNERLLDQDASLRAQACQQAQRAFTSDAERGLKAQELADRAAQMEGRMGIAGEELGLRAAQELGRLGGLEQQYGLRSADVLRQIGEQRQAQEQQLLDIGYSDFLSQRDFPRQQLGFLSGIMHGVPVSPQSETSLYQRPPSSGQQLLGYGLGGLGLARSVFGQGG